MLVGIIGAPNKGKSTMFSALTSTDAKIANYPFTTIDPNKGVAYASTQCAEKRIGKKCNPRNSLCENGTRLIPVNLIDVAGLVPGAHEGKGMGNQFLNDLSAADAFIIVVDASGKTDESGNPNPGDPSADLDMVTGELTDWIAGIIKKNMPRISKSDSAAEALANALTGFNVGKSAIEESISKLGLSSSRISWTDSEIASFAKMAVLGSKRFIVAANKADDPESARHIEGLKSKAKSLGMEVVMCSAAIELALQKAKKSGVISYNPWENGFSIISEAKDEQKKALEYMHGYVSKEGTGVQKLLNELVFSVMKQIVVYPVEDDGKFSDHSGNVLPDAIMLTSGSTAYDLALKIHTDIAKGMLYAIDAVSKMRLAKSYALRDSDIIKIVSAAR